MCALIFQTGKTIFNRNTGIIAGTFSVFYLPFIKSAELLLTELLFTSILLLAIYTLALSMRAGRGVLYSALSGALIAVSLLSRSTMLLFPLFAIPLFIDEKDRAR